MLTAAAFVALWMIDTTALLELIWFTVTGGRDISPLWVLIVLLAVAGLWLIWQGGKPVPGQKGKPSGRAGNKARPRKRGQAGARVDAGPPSDKAAPEL